MIQYMYIRLYYHVNVYISILCNASGALTCLTLQIPWELPSFKTQEIRYLEQLSYKKEHIRTQSATAVCNVLAMSVNGVPCTCAFVVALVCLVSLLFRVSFPLETSSKRLSIIYTLRWHLFASTFFCDFGLNHLLRVLNFVISTWKWYRVDKF